MENSGAAAEAAKQVRWRTGRKLGRTIYMQLLDEPSGSDIVIGMLDNVEVAKYVVELHNAWVGGELQG